MHDPDIDGDAMRGPLAGVVDEISDHLLEILPFAPEADARRRAYVDRQVFVPVNFLKSSGEPADHGLDLRNGAEGPSQRCRTRSIKVIIDLIAHYAGLFTNFGGKLLRRLFNLVDDDAQGRLEGVGEIAHLRSRPL